MTEKKSRLARMTAILLSLPVLIAAGALCLYAAAGFLLLPYYVKQELPRFAEARLKSGADIGEVRFNPFLLKLEITDFRVTEEGAAEPFLAFDRLFVDLEAMSLLRLAAHFNEIALDGLRLTMHIDKTGELNIGRVIARLQDKEPKPEDKGELPRLLIEKAALHAGSITFIDESTPEAMRADVQDFAVQFDGISTLPNDRGAYTLSARLKGGGTLGWRGGLTLQPLASDGELALKDFGLHAMHPYLSRYLRIDDPAGSLDATFRYAIAWRDGKLSFNASDIGGSVAGLQLRAAGVKEPMLKLESVRLAGGTLDLAEKKLSFTEFVAAKGNVAAQMDATGTTDWEKLIVAATPRNPGGNEPKPSAAAPAISDRVKKGSGHSRNGPAAPGGEKGKPPQSAPAVATADAAGWQVGVESVRLEDVAVRFVDESRVQPFVADVGDVDIGFAASLDTGKGSVLLDKLAVHLGKVTIAAVGATKPSITLDEFRTDGGRIDLGTSTATLGGISMSGGSTGVVRLADGSINLERLFTARDPKPSTTSFSVVVGEVNLGGYALSYSDEALGAPLTYDLGEVKMQAGGVQSDMKKPIRFDVGATVRQGGSLKAGGTYDAAKGRAEVKVALNALSLMPLEPVLSRYVTIKLVKGTVSTEGRLVMDQQAKEPGLRYGGALSIDDLQFNEANNDRFLAWKTLAATGMYLNLAQSRVSIADVRLAEAFTKILIAKDRSVNLAAIVRPQTGNAPSAPKAPAASAPAAESVADHFGATVDRIRGEKAEVQFADLSLVLPFATYVKDLNGVITGLSREKSARAGVKLDGQVENYGLARVGGTINLFAPKVHTNLDVAFRNVEMTPLSPYSATFAGRKIESGRLSLDLQYRIEKSELQGENKMMLEKFKLGERVESPTAVNLPLDLAIAVLTDSDDRINIAVPVRGNVDNPEFSYGHLVWQAIRTVLANIVTAPFRALGRLFGGATERAEDVVFDAGSIKLLPPEREKLDALAKTLASRPQLKVSVQGRWNDVVDGKALREVAVQRELSVRGGIKLAPDEEPGPPLIDRARTQRALEAMLEELGGADAVAKFVAQVEKERGKPASRLNPALALVGRGSEDRALYEAMYRRVVDLWKLAPSALQDLAVARAKAIGAQLNTSGLEVARVASQPAAAMTGDTASAKLGLEVAR